MLLVPSLVALASLLVVTLAVTTGLGERRRGGRIWLAVVAGALFPLTWVGWYVRDERPRRTLGRRAA